jgi:FAD/FMN-containing dehydrogenase
VQGADRHRHVGLRRHGGIGFSTRASGWACDQLVEVQCVLADGSVVVANADNEYADLYRACKGAGAAGLCVMTRLVTLSRHRISLRAPR